MRLYCTAFIRKRGYCSISQSQLLHQVERFISGQQTHWDKFGYGNWGILPAGEAEIIGWVGLQFVTELDKTEVGFLLNRPSWGKGFATEAARASLVFGFEHFGFDSIIALVHPENVASSRVIEKCRMGYEETISLWGMKLKRYSVDRVTFMTPVEKEKL
jgi:RimJ/RimL family protein N-acetyltransferase